jgi:uncharacterized membrane protein
MTALTKFALLCLGFAGLAAAAAMFLDAAEPHGAAWMAAVVVFAIVVGWVLLHRIVNTYDQISDDQ